MWHSFFNSTYNLLARIMPGMFILVVAYVTVLDIKFVGLNIPQLYSYVNSVKNANLLSLMLLLLFSHLTGCIVHEIWALLFSSIEENKLSQKNGDGVTTINGNNALRKLLGSPELTIVASDVPKINLLYEQLRLLSPTEAQRLLKLRGEARMFQTLFGGLLLLLLANGVSWIYEGVLVNTLRIIYIFSLGVMMFLFWRRVLVCLRNYYNRTLTMWLLINYPVLVKTDTLTNDIKP